MPMDRMFRVFLLLCAVMTPAFAQVNDANTHHIDNQELFSIETVVSDMESSQLAGEAIKLSHTIRDTMMEKLNGVMGNGKTLIDSGNMMDSMKSAFLRVDDVVENAAHSMATALSEMKSVLPGFDSNKLTADTIQLIQTTEALVKNDNGTDWSWINFAGNVMNIRSQLESVNVTHIGLSHTAHQALQGLSLAFFISFFLFIISSLLTIIQGIATRKSKGRAGGVSLVQQFLAMLYMIPYSAFYVMLALMMSVVLVAFLLMFSQISRVIADSQIRQKSGSLFSQVKTFLETFGSMLSTYLEEDVPTFEQLQQLQGNFTVLVNSTVALTTEVAKADETFQSFGTGNQSSDQTHNQ